MTEGGDVMRKARKLLTGILLSILVMNALNIPTMEVYAAEVDEPIWEDPVDPMTYISSYGCNFTISSSGVTSLSGYIKGKPGVDDAYVLVTLQKQVSGGWSNVTSWDDQGGRNASVSETYNVSRGTYRIEVYCSAGTESKTFDSASKTY